MPSTLVSGSNQAVRNTDRVPTQTFFVSLYGGDSSSSMDQAKQPQVDRSERFITRVAVSAASTEEACDLALRAFFNDTKSWEGCVITRAHPAGL